MIEFTTKNSKTHLWITVGFWTQKKMWNMLPSSLINASTVLFSFSFEQFLIFNNAPFIQTNWITFIKKIANMILSQSFKIRGYIFVLRTVYISFFPYTCDIFVRTHVGSCNTRYWEHTAQYFYREGHAYIVKNLMVCLTGPNTKFLWFWDGQNWNFPK